MSDVRIMKKIGRNAAGGKLGKKRAVIPSTENILFSEEQQLCGCG